MVAQGLFKYAPSANASLHRSPGGLNGLGIGPCVRVDKVARVIDRKVIETLSVQSIIGFPTIRHNCRFCFDMSTNNGQQCLSITTVTWTHLDPKLPCVGINNAQYLCSWDQAPTVKFSAANHGLIDLNHRTRSSQLSLIHPIIDPLDTCIPADLIPVCDCRG